MLVKFGLKEKIMKNFLVIVLKVYFLFIFISIPNIRVIYPLSTFSFMF